MKLSRNVLQRIERLELPFNQDGVDPYGVTKDNLAVSYTLLGWLYKRYLSCRTVGIEHVPTSGRAMLVGNHSGGVALDGAMVISACFFDMEPPRLAHGMAEKFLNRIPFAAEWSQKTGHFTGLPEHAERLLRDERLLLVFPEGARGTAKLFPERHSLVRFGTGFMRLALQTGTPIIPFGFVGGGDAIPTMMNLYRLGRLFGAPYIPVTPYLLPIPLPVSVGLRFGPAMRFEGDGTEDDTAVEGWVSDVKAQIAALIDASLGRDGGY